MDLAAEAATPKDLFEALAQQLFDQLVEQNDVGLTLREIIMVDAPDLSGVLLEGLRALHGLFADQKMVFGEASVTELSNPAPGHFSLRVQATGELQDPQRHIFHVNPRDWAVEALLITRTPQGYQARVTLQRPSPKQ